MFARLVTSFVLSFMAVAGIFAATERTAIAQTPAAASPSPLPPQKPPMTEQVKEKSLPAMQLFGGKQLPSLGKAMAIGYYPRGCLAGGVELPINGPTWQVMRLSRNRNWGHPSLIRVLESLANKARAQAGWPGLLVGDMSQPRGGPMLTGHASHQVGLDADIWLTPMPDRELTRTEREEMSATNVVAADR